MAEVTKNFGLVKIDRNEYVRIATINENMDIIDEKLGEVAAKEVVLTPDFNNPLCWVGCTRVTPPETEAGVTTEEWKDSATRTITRARRTTTENADGSYTEVYEFYSADGKTLESKYTVLTTQDGETETYYEKVTQEVIE